MHARTDGRTDGRTDRQTDGRTDGRTDRLTENIYSIFRDKLLLLVVTRGVYIFCKIYSH